MDLYDILQKDALGLHKCPLSNTKTFRDWGLKAWETVYGVQDSFVNKEVDIIICMLHNVTSIRSREECEGLVDAGATSGGSFCHIEDQKCQSAGRGGVKLDEDGFKLNMECGFECSVGKGEVGEALHIMTLLGDILRLAMDAGASSHCPDYRPDESGDPAKCWHSAATQIAEQVIQGYSDANSSGASGFLNFVEETQEPYKKYMAKLFPPKDP